MVRLHKIIYWVATIWLALGMLSTATVQLLRFDTENEYITQLGYPAYVLTLLGVWKVLGVVAILVPGFALVKEWAYAGFFFAMSGAVFSHIVLGEALDKWFPSVLLLVPTVVSWYFRPTNRKTIALLLR